MKEIKISDVTAEFIAKLPKWVNKIEVVAIDQDHNTWDKMEFDWEDGLNGWNEEDTWKKLTPYQVSKRILDFNRSYVKDNDWMYKHGNILTFIEFKNDDNDNIYAVCNPKLVAGYYKYINSITGKFNMKARKTSAPRRKSGLPNFTKAFRKML